MEPLVKTWTTNQQVASSDLNSIQLNLYGLRAASGTNSWSNIPGIQEVAFQSVSDFNTGGDLLIDDSIDWRDRIVRGEYLEHGGSTDYPGGAGDYAFASSATVYRFIFYTGTGALDAGGSAPTPGNPPVIASGKYACMIYADMWIYCDPTTGKLKLYNNTGGTKKIPTVFARCTADLGKR